LSARDSTEALPSTMAPYRSWRPRRKAPAAAIGLRPNRAASSFEKPLNQLERATLFRGLSASQCQEIDGAGRERTFSQGDSIIVEGDAMHSVSLLMVGRAKTVRHSAVGKLVILHVVGPGEILDGIGYGLGSTHSLGAYALEPCRILIWDIAAFESLSQRFPALLRNSVRLLGQRMRSLEGRVHEFATERVPQRLARVLLRLIADSGSSFDSDPVDLSCEELAQMAGTTLFTVSRLLCEWASQGIIRPERSAILFENLPGLIAVAMQDTPLQDTRRDTALGRSGEAKHARGTAPDEPAARRIL
jgi:CRP/FNR family transcriptional regulator, nitrogen oxide reductase regulator